MKKVALLLLVLGLILAFFGLDLNRFLTLDGLKDGLAQFEAWRAASPI